MRRLLAGAVMALASATSLAAQAAAPRPVPAAADQITAAVQPLPEAMRAGARVWGYAPDGSFTELRPGSGVMTCIANDPKGERFHVACYHNSMEPFMARGRELRAQGKGRAEVDSLRTADVTAGRIRMPASASLYSLTGGRWDPATHTVRGASPLYVLYVPFATAGQLGLPETPNGNMPWMMHAGAPNAHIMITPQMSPPAAPARPARP
jgi:hypothetical protein